ncbi:hypothetical protein ACU20_05820 [Actinobaculum suis]|nr:hypothetical protein ACU20_05820 [Actinobaculum suis]
MPWARPRSSFRHRRSPSVFFSATYPGSVSAAFRSRLPFPGFPVTFPSGFPVTFSSRFSGNVSALFAQFLFFPIFDNDAVLPPVPRATPATSHPSTRWSYSFLPRISELDIFGAYPAPDNCIPGQY